MGSRTGELNELVVALFLDPSQRQLPVPPTGHGAHEADLPLTGDMVLEPWMREALRLVKEGAVDAARLGEVIGRAVNLEGPNSDYVLELLALVARALGDDASQQTAVQIRLERLVAAARIELGNARRQGTLTRKLSRIARAAVSAVDEATVTVDPRLHAEVLLAWGGTFTFADDRRLDQAFPLYIGALRLFRQASAPEAADLEDLIGRMIDEQLRASLGAGFFGGRDVSPRGLEAALDAASAIGRADLVFAVALALSESYSAVGQPGRAEAMVHDLLASAELSGEQRLRLRSELAAAISEQHRFSEALRLQTELIAELRQRGTLRSVELVRLGNFRRETGDLPGAVGAFEEALALTGPPKDGTVDTHRVHAQALLGQARVLMGDRSGLALLDEAVATLGPVPAVAGLHLYRIMLDSAMTAGDHDRARRALQAGRQIQRHHLQRAPEMDVWHGLLDPWAPLDYAEVELALADDGDGPVAALLAAEAAKGRILRWAAAGLTAEAAARSVAGERNEQDLALVQGWLERRGRTTRVVSLFAAAGGVAVLMMRAGAPVEGTWLGQLSYPELAVDVFDTWTELLDAGTAGDRTAWKAAGAITDSLLRWAGELLWRAVPDLADGGGELVILPHRILRVLPLWAAVLPGGARLGQLFEQVTVLPNLEELARRVDDTAGRADGEVRAFADPDGSLPFARLEAIAVAGQSAILGGGVTEAAVREALAARSPAIVHLACHGDFDAGNPWMSAIHTAEGDLLVHELLLGAQGAAPVVVLGACEAGRTHRTPSDEPLGFPALLLRRGAAAVIAPSWPVDDLASLLLLTELYRRRKDTAMATALVGAATWLRDLQASEAVARLEELARASVDASGAAETEAGSHTVRTRLDATLSWLRSLPARERPFRSPLDWAAFQIYGMPALSTVRSDL
jgi:hypothetical protein